MTVARLVPSSYAVSDNTYVAVSDASNMYANTDSTSYGTATHSRSSTSYTYYFYLGGFNFSDIPSNAVVSSYAIKIRAYQTGHTTSTSGTYQAKLYNDNSQLYNTNVTMPSTVNTITFPTNDYTWNDIKTIGSNLRITIPLRRQSRNTADVAYIYGAEIEVTYSTGTVNVTGVTLDESSASIEVGGTVQLTATVAPSNATDKSVSWSSSNTSVATVSSSGVVTAVSAGSANITVTTTDGGYTATCAVTVTPAVTYEYVLTDTMVVGKTYLLANGNSGSVYLLTNESGGTRLLKGASATVSSNKISITSAVKSKAEFECVRYTSGNDNTITVKSDNKYLYCDNANGLRMNNPATLDRFWHYRSGKFWQFKSTVSDGYSDTSSEYKYYLTLSGTNFTDSHVDTAGIEQSNIPLVYIYEPYVPSDDAIYFKDNGAWVEATAVYKKVNGSWVQQSDLTTVFQSGVNYVKGN